MMRMMCGMFRSRCFRAAAIDSGAKKLFCEYTDAQHDIWTKTYNEPLVHRWLFKQVKPRVDLDAQILCNGIGDRFG